jgi:hypothetical protein
VGLSERVTYIYRMQQQEADAIGISKIDLLTASEREQVELLIRAQFPGRHVFGFSARTGEGFDTLLSVLDSGGSGGGALHNLDYDVYAEGEAELGWLNSHAHLECQPPQAMDDSLLQLGHAIHDACTARGLEIAHGKLSLAADGHLAVVNLVDSGSPPEVSRSSEAAAATMELTINLRVQAEPSALEQVVQTSHESWIERRGLTISAAIGQCFKPGRPVPTHRMC